MIVPQYRPGQWWAAVAEGTVLVLPPSTPATLVAELWTAVHDGAALTDHLQVLLRPGIAHLPPFALVSLEGRAAHVVVRGEVKVDVTTASGVRTLSAAHVRTWAEDVVQDATAVTVRVADGARAHDVTDLLLPVLSAVVRAEEVVVALGTGAEGAPTEPVVVAAPGPVAPDAEPAAPAPEPAAPAPEPAAPAPEPVVAAPAPEPVAAAPSPVVVPFALDDPFDGAAVVVDEPAADEDEDDDVVPPPLPRWERVVPGSAPPFASAVLPPPVPAPAAAPAPAPVGDADERSEPAYAMAGDHPTEDHDGLTVLSSDVVALRRQLPAWAGDAVPALAVPTPRTPPPAKLQMSSGLVVSLNRPVLIGRAPQVTRVPNNEIPRLLTVASPNQDISRTHAEVRMDGEDVIVTDLRSTNGVLLLRQGAGPQRLHPGEPTVVEPGVVVDLGEGVTFIVEAGG